jgi:hypothetical protein
VRETDSTSRATVKAEIETAPTAATNALTANGGASENPPILKFEREDWTLFRTVEGLQQKAGVSKDKLPRLVLKELADNGLDNGAKVSVGELPKGGYFVEDDGPGIDGTPEDVARLFSIRRPMVSTKLLRLPQRRGALGNGLRVAAGAVLASGGSLTVTTRNRRIELRPERDGSTTVVSAKTVKFPVGTRIEIVLGPALPCDMNTLYWARIACQMARTGSTYQGKSSPLWFDVAAFHELLDAAGDRPVCELIAQLDGKIATAGLASTICKNITVQQATKLLKAARENSLPIDPARLGAINAEAFPNHSYARAYGVLRLGSGAPLAEIPFAVESWVKARDDETALQVCVNRTPITGEIRATRDNRDIDFFGCGLHHTIAKAAKDTQFNIWLNITVPYMPITSDGKAPDLIPFFDAICSVVGKAVYAARRPTPEHGSLLPKRRRGRQSPEDDAAYHQQVAAFCALIRRINSKLDFAVGSRGWCYLLEPHGLFKGDFDTAEKLITE